MVAASPARHRQRDDKEMRQPEVQTVARLTRCDRQFALGTPIIEGLTMNNQVNAGLIVAVAILLAVGLYIYFSPYQSCVRAYDKPGAGVLCARLLGGTT